MGFLTKTAPKLLKVVHNAPHATAEDHESSDAVTSAPLPTPPHSARVSRSKRKSEARQPAAEPIEIEDEEPQSAKDQQQEDEDFLRDPESSSDEADGDMAGGKREAAASNSGFRTNKPPVLDIKASGPSSDSTFQPMARSTVLDEGRYKVEKPGIKRPAVSSASITAPKREWTDAELDDDVSDPEFMRSSQAKKKKPNNMHAAPRSTPTVFGKKNDQKARIRQAEEAARRKKEEKEKQNETFKRAGRTVDDPVIPTAVFKRHNLPALHSSGTTAGAADNESRPDGLRSPSPEPQSMSNVCDTCHERVDKLIKEEYLDNYVKGKSWNIQWQERFCEWHRARTAKELWKEKGYPEINWTGLERRMRKYDDFLLSVLRNETTSHYRQEYAAKVKAKSMSDGFKDAAVKPGATVGYYGPKGEKAMSEHILSGLSDEIRERAKTDRLVSPSGYQGGISGFVQGVLVPHLAELLIKDDMKLVGHEWAMEAREIIAESADVGELVHPDVEEHSQEDEAKADWML